jgi:hypothetical protein
MDYTAWSQTFILDTPDTTCIVDVGEWRKIHDEFPEAKRIFAKVFTLYSEDAYYVALGSPVYDEMNFTNGTANKSIYLPQSILETLRIQGSGEPVKVEWLTNEYFPEATRIVLRPHDSAFFHADAKEELERALTRIGVLQSCTTISVPLQMLGGFNVSLDVITLEPANIVLMEGDEVSIEFEKALDAMDEDLAAVPEVAAEPVPEPVGILDDLSTKPDEKFSGEGNTLGGVTKPRLADGRAWNPWR